MSVTPLDEGLPRFCDFRCAHGRCRVAPGIADIGQHGGDFVVFQQPAEFGQSRPRSAPRASLRHDQGPDGSNPLPDEDAAKGRHRDGAARSRLQSHPGHEHHGCPTAHGGNAGIDPAAAPLSAAAERPRRSGSASGATSDQKLVKLAKMTEFACCSDVSSRQCFCRSVFRTAKTHSGRRIRALRELSEGLTQSWFPFSQIIDCNDAQPCR